MNDYFIDRSEWIEEMFFDAWSNYEDLKEQQEQDDYFSQALTPEQRNRNLR